MGLSMYLGVNEGFRYSGKDVVLTSQNPALLSVGRDIHCVPSGVDVPLEQEVMLHHTQQGDWEQYNPRRQLHFYVTAPREIKIEPKKYHPLQVRRVSPGNVAIVEGEEGKIQLDIKVISKRGVGTTTTYKNDVKDTFLVTGTERTRAPFVDFRVVRTMRGAADIAFCFDPLWFTLLTR